MPPVQASAAGPAAEARADAGSEMQRLKALLPELHALPLWEHYEKIVTRAPAEDVPSRLWKWSALEPALALARTAVQGKDADHRVLVLQNPDLGGRLGTCGSILAAVQLVMPGERTLEHRHTPSTLRVVLKSAGGASHVDGARLEMRDGDLIVTPSWTWHWHENDTDAPAVWVDVLDVPFVKQLNGVFGALGPAQGYPAEAPTTLRHAWTDTRAALAAAAPDAGGARTVRYSDPADGRPVTPTLDASATELERGRPSARRRSSSTALCIVLEGSGRSTVGDAVHEWSAFDVFTVPEWRWLAHEADSERARLVTISDAPLRRALGLHREEPDQPHS